LLAEPALAHGHAAAGHHVRESLPIVAYVSNARRGEVMLMTADREVRVRDRALVARIVRAAR
jgi:hypothetical protein